MQLWLRRERGRLPDGGSIAAAVDYSLNSWPALTCHLDDGTVPIGNNFIERQIKPWAMGRKAWLFCGSELAGQRAAIVMSLVQSAKLNGHDPWAYLRDVLERPPSHPATVTDPLLDSCNNAVARAVRIWRRRIARVDRPQAKRGATPKRASGIAAHAARTAPAARRR